MPPDGHTKRQHAQETFLLELSLNDCSCVGYCYCILLKPHIFLSMSTEKSIYSGFSSITPCPRPKGGSEHLLVQCCQFLDIIHMKISMQNSMNTSPSAVEYWRGEHLEAFWIITLTATTFAGPVALRGRLGDFHFNADPVFRKFYIGIMMPELKMNTPLQQRCCPDKAMVYTNHGMNAYVIWCITHYVVTTIAVAKRFPNRGTLCASACYHFV